MPPLYGHILSGQPLFCSQGPKHQLPSTLSNPPSESPPFSPLHERLWSTYDNIKLITVSSGLTRKQALRWGWDCKVFIAWRSGDVVGPRKDEGGESGTGLGEPQTVLHIAQSGRPLGQRTFIRGCLLTLLLAREQGVLS